MTDFKTGPAEAGAVIAKAQDVTKTCSGMNNHIHVELRKDGTLQDPTPFVNE